MFSQIVKPLHKRGNTIYAQREKNIALLSNLFHSLNSLPKITCKTTKPGRLTHRKQSEARVVWLAQHTIIPSISRVCPEPL